MPWPLEPSADEMRHLVSCAMERIVVHLASLPDQPSGNVAGAAELARSLVEPLPEQGGASIEALLDLLFDRAVPTTFNTAGPGYLAYIPGGGLFHSAVADLIADSVNRYTGVWIAAPGLVQLEVNVLRWFAQMVGLPTSARGVLTTGGSLANFSAVVAARRAKLPEDFRNGTLYVSDQVHYSATKAAALAGFPADAVRMVESDERFCMRTDRLDDMVAADRQAGRQPFLVVGSGGTVNTGAVDDLAALADLAEREGMWFHVDGAYGGFFVMTERGRSSLAGIERADSVTLDPHKGLFLPYGTGCLLARDGDALRRAHAAHGEYLPEMQDDPDFVDFCQLSPELSRAYRGLRIWLPFKLVGAGAFRAALDEKLDLTQWAWEQLRQIKSLEIVAEPQLSIVAFRYRRPGLDDAALNQLNRQLLEGINGRKRVYMTGTTVRGQFVLRICVLSFRTHRDRMEAGLDDIRAEVARLDDRF